MEKLIFTTIQSNLHWENKSANLEVFEKKILGINEKTNIVLLPEMFSTGFSMQPELFAETMDGETVNWMRHLSKQKNIILGGSMMVTENGEYYNRFVWMQPNGQYGYYDKRHCFSLAGEDQHYASGNKRTIASVGGWKINLQICYDLRFPVWSRQQLQQNEQNEFLPEYDVLVYVANWPERRNHAWKTLLQARAIENQCFVIGVNRIGNDGNNIYHSGDSMVVDPLGEVLYHKAHEEDVHTITIEKNKLSDIRSRLPFWKDADGFLVVD
jgi:predicted amidohydrolase